MKFILFGWILPLLTLGGGYLFWPVSSFFKNHRLSLHLKINFFLQLTVQTLSCLPFVYYIIYKEGNALYAVRGLALIGFSFIVINTIIVIKNAYKPGIFNEGSST